MVNGLYYYIILLVNGCIIDVQDQKGVTLRFSRNSACRKCVGNIGEPVEQEEKLYNEVETVREFTYLGDRVSAGGGCEAAVTPEQDVCGLSLRSVVSCCLAGGLL